MPGMSIKLLVTDFTVSPYGRANRVYYNVQLHSPVLTLWPTHRKLNMSQV